MESVPVQHPRQHYAQITEKLVAAELRPTRQRILLGALLWGKGHRHLTAEGLHNEAKDAQIKVSLATIYNTLHQFTEAGLLREIIVESGRSYFDTNIDPHHHFLHEDTGMLEDVCASKVDIRTMPPPPQGKAIRGVDVVIRVG